MLARVQSYLLQGIDALACEVEVHVEEAAEPKTIVVGLPDTAVKEATERVRAALANSGYFFPSDKVLVNLAPADVRKEGPVYDLPIAVGLLVAQGVIRQSPKKGQEDDGGLDLRGAVIAGELALDGRVRPIRGAIALASMARARGMKTVIVPAENAREAALVPDLEVYGVRTLAEVVGLVTGRDRDGSHASGGHRVHAGHGDSAGGLCGGAWAGVGEACDRGECRGRTQLAQVVRKWRPRFPGIQPEARLRADEAESDRVQRQLMPKSHSLACDRDRAEPVQRRRAGLK
jgi:hypothetical protein